MKLTPKRKKIGLAISGFFIGLLLILIALFALALPLSSKNILAIKILATSNPVFVAEYQTKYANTFEPGIEVEIREIAPVKIPIEYTKEELSDSKYLVDHKFVVKGVNGEITQYYYSVDFNWLGMSLNKKILRDTQQTAPSSEKTISGEASSEVVASDIKSYFNQLISELSNDSNISDKTILQNITFGDSTINQDVSFETDSSPVGKIVITLGNCNKTIDESINYNYKTQTWEVTEKDAFVGRLCAPQFTKSGDKLIGTCKDCTLFPVNKQYGLRSDYVPDVVTFDLQTNVLIARSTFNDLRLMYKDAQANGHSIWINSSYRSYSTQLNTFEGWVKTEMASGKDRASAESAANSYSARAGFSEHQLGTTVDIVTTQCVSFGRGCAQSEALWAWLKENSYKYGFILSYPQDKETGYVYEPWHFRWIGRDLASEYKKVESTKTLQQFLLENNQY